MPTGINQTMMIIGITCLISFMAFSNDTLKSRLIFWPPAIAKGQVDRFVAHGFIHADGNHLLFNMITLFFFGKYIEAIYKPALGGLGFVLFYLAAIAVAIFPSYLSNKNNAQYASLGASGAVSAVLFAFILLDPWNILLIFFIPMPAIIFAIAYTGYSVWAQKKGNDNINHSAHLWGAAFGIIMTIIYQPAIVPHFLEKLMQPGFLN